MIGGGVSWEVFIRVQGRNDEDLIIGGRGKGGKII